MSRCLCSFIFLIISRLCVTCVEDIYQSCDPYNTFCLFSFGPNIAVSNVTEARRICTNAKTGSHLLEISNPEELEAAKLFKNDVAKMSDVKAIIGKTALQDITLFENGFFSSTFGMKDKISNNKSEFVVICMTECLAEWKIYNGSNEIIGMTRPNDGYSTRCTIRCETNRTLDCKAVEWATRYKNLCYTWHAEEIPEINDYAEMLYVIDRSVKTTDRCIGELTRPNLSHSVKNSHWAAIKELMTVIVSLVGSVLFFSIFCLVVNKLCLKIIRNKRKKIHYKQETPDVVPAEPRNPKEMELPDPPHEEDDYFNIGEVRHSGNTLNAKSAQ